MSPRFEPRRIHILLIIAATVLFLAPTLDNYWIKDDLAVRYFTEGNDLAWEKVKTIFWPDHLEREHWWRPIPFLTIFADFEVWFTNPVGYHVFNTLLHAFVGILVYLLVNRLTNFENGLAGFVAAIAVIIDPVNCESVVWAVQRIVPICAAASLLGMLAWLRAAEGGGRGLRVFGYVMLFLAIFTKEVGCTLPGIYFLIDLLYARRGTPFSARLRSAIRWAIPSAVLLAIYFACRYAMWNRMDILYAGMEPMQYAKEFRVFERMGSSLLHSFVPVNASLFEGWRHDVVSGLVLAGYGIAALRALPLLILNAAFRKLTLVALVFFGLSFVPSMPIFWVDENLFNARFFYQPSIASLMIVGAALWLPVGEGRGKAGVAFGTLGTVLLLAGLGVAMALHLTAFEGAGEQVRGIQTSIAAYAEEEEKSSGVLPIVVAIDTPSQVYGVPTLETSLEHALVRPLNPRDIEVIALTDTLRGTPAWTDYLASRLGDRSTDRLRFVDCRRNPPSIEPVFGAPQAEEGRSPARILAPDDNAWFRNDGASPVFRFRSRGGAKSFVLVVATPDRPEPIRINLDPRTNCRVDGGRIAYDFSGRDAKIPEVPDLWESAIRKPQPNPVPATWRIESYDADGALMGVSEERRIIVFNVL